MLKKFITSTLLLSTCVLVQAEEKTVIMDVEGKKFKTANQATLSYCSCH
jgi:hypothetical protein